MGEMDLKPQTQAVAQLEAATTQGSAWARRSASASALVWAA